MNVCLTNRCRVDEARMRAAARLSTRTQRCLYLLFGALALVGGAFSVLRWVKDGPPGFSKVVGAFALFALGFFLVREAFTMVGRTVRRSMALRRQKGAPEVLEYSFRFGPSEIERENSFTRQPNAIPYEQIEKILRTGTELQLCLKNKLYYILDPNRFENGTEADFWRLMNEKCSAAVPKKYRA